MKNTSEHRNMLSVLFAPTLELHDWQPLVLVVSRISTFAVISLPFLICLSTTNAAPFSFTWSETINSQFSPVLPPGVSLGDPFSMTITVDNGGTSHLSQTWSSGDFVSATINANNGAYTATRVAPLYEMTGAFQTDGTGDLTAVPSWAGYDSAIGSYADSLGNTPANSGDGGFFDNGANVVWYIDSPFSGGLELSISVNNVSGNQSAENWVASWSVPEPSSLALVVAAFCLPLRRRS